MNEQGFNSEPRVNVGQTGAVQADMLFGTGVASDETQTVAVPSNIPQGMTNPYTQQNVQSQAYQPSSAWAGDVQASAEPQAELPSSAFMPQAFAHYQDQPTVQPVVQPLSYTQGTQMGQPIGQPIGQYAGQPASQPMSQLIGQDGQLAGQPVTQAMNQEAPSFAQPQTFDQSVFQSFTLPLEQDASRQEAQTTQHFPQDQDASALDAPTMHDLSLEQDVSALDAPTAHDQLFDQTIAAESQDRTAPSSLASIEAPGKTPISIAEDDGDDVDDEDEVDESSKYAFMQNRELSWLTFNERVLDQGADESVPLLERLNFISIFWSNLQEFFMVRVGSLTDLSFIDPPVTDSKTGMTPKEQIQAIHERCRELYPIQESYYEHVRGSLAKHGVRHLRPDDLSEEQVNYLSGFVTYNVNPFLSPQIINPTHPFPHLENGKLYILVRLDDEGDEEERKKKGKKAKKAKKEKGGAEGVVLGLIPLPHQCERIIKLPGRGFQFILLEHAIEMFAAETFSMYKIKHTNVICVTRNADIDANQTGDEQDEDYREHMRRLLKQRARLAPVRLECERPLSPVMEKHLLKKLGLKRYQVYDTIVPLDLSFTWGLGGYLTEKKREKLSNPPFTPAWPVAFDRKRRIIDQVGEREVLLSYPYESMDPFVQLLKEAAFDPTVVSIKITLYRLASQSQLAEALITAAENGKNVTALFELRARFDESNNIEWSQRFEEAGCNVIYGFHDYKVHSKICCITRQTPQGLQHITQLGTGNYNEKTAKLYTDLSFITTSEAFARDAVEFFRNMQLENVSDNYEILRVAPLQIKSMILNNLDKQIALAHQGKPCGAFLKANSITDKDVIEKIAEASQAGVGVTLFIRGICCIVPEVKGWTDNVRVVSIVGRLLEHSRIYCFGTPDDCVMYLSSADLMTRNLNKRVEIAWPIISEDIRRRILSYIDVCLRDTAKLRELRPNKTYTPLGAFCEIDEEGNAQPAFDSQAALIERAAAAAKRIVDEQDAEEQKDEDSVAVDFDAEGMQTYAGGIAQQPYGTISKQETPGEGDLQSVYGPIDGANFGIAQPETASNEKPAYGGMPVPPNPTAPTETYMQPIYAETPVQPVYPDMSVFPEAPSQEREPGSIPENLSEMRIGDFINPIASEPDLAPSGSAVSDFVPFTDMVSMSYPASESSIAPVSETISQNAVPGFDGRQTEQVPEQQSIPVTSESNLAGMVSSQSTVGGEGSLTDMNVGDILSPAMGDQPMRIFIGQSDQGSNAESEDAPLRVFLGQDGQDTGAAGDEPLRIFVADQEFNGASQGAMPGEAGQLGTMQPGIQSQPPEMQYDWSNQQQMNQPYQQNPYQTPQQPASGQPMPNGRRQDGFFEGDNRPYEMPPQKKGLFRRFRKK